MKKSFQYICGVLALLAVLASCKKSELKTFDGKTSIYFPRNTTIDTLAVTFTFQPLSVTDSLIKIPVRIAGEPAPVDRPYALRINEDRTTAVAGVDYEMKDLGTFSIPAGKVTDTIYLTLKRSPGLLTESKKVSLRLDPNENFQTDILFKVTNSLTGARLSYVDYTITFDDILKKPGRWLDTYLGVFTRAKALLMIEVMGIDLAYLDASAAVADIVFYGKFMQRYLNEKNAMGETIYEEDGTPMAMGPSVQ
mgnify:CR=1 FL=1